MTLTKNSIVEALAQATGLSKRDTQAIAEAFFEEIKLSLQHGEGVKLPNFGSFILSEKSARPGRNPKTGAPNDVSARRVVTFRTSNSLKEKLRCQDI